MASFTIAVKGAGILGLGVGLILGGCGSRPTGGTGGAGGSGGSAGVGGFGGSAGIGGSGGSGGAPGTCGFQTTGTAQYTSGWSTNPAYTGGTMYYPTNTSNFGGIVILPGFVTPVSAMATWGPFFASRGMAAFLVDPPSSSDLPAQRSAAQLAALNSLKAENSRSGSPLFNKLNLNALAIAGWSMGGGGTLDSANQNPQGVRAAVAFAPWESGTNYGGIRIPTLVLAGGSADTLVAHSMSRGEYDGIASGTPKAYIEISGADHFQWTSPTGASGSAGTYAWAWINAYVNGHTECKGVIVRTAADADFASSSL